MSARAVDGQGEGERKQIQLQIAPPVHGSRRPQALTNLEYQYAAEKRHDFVIIHSQVHGISALRFFPIIGPPIPRNSALAFAKKSGLRGSFFEKMRFREKLFNSFFDTLCGASFYSQIR